MKETVSGIFERYGLNAEDFRPQGPPPGDAASAPGGSGLVEDTESTETSLMETLLEILEEQVENGELDADTAATVLSQRVLDTLFGFDAEA